MELNLRTLSRLEPICGLSSARLEELVRLCVPETHARGSDPLRDIGVGAHLVFLLAGELKIVLLDGSMRVLVGGCDIANWPIGYKTVLPLSSKAITDVTLLRIDFELLDIMMTWDDLSAAVDPAPAPEWGKMTGAFSAQALTAGALAQLPPAHIHELLQRFERIVVRRGASVIKEGEPGDYYYLIESGRCEVFKRVGGADVRLAEFKAGDAFGEEALVSDSPAQCFGGDENGWRAGFVWPNPIFSPCCAPPCCMRLADRQPMPKLRPALAGWMCVTPPSSPKTACLARSTCP